MKNFSYFCDQNIESKPKNFFLLLMLAIFGIVVKPEKFILTINGKELDRTHGLDWYDYGARQYDPFVPGFTSLDPMCEKYYYVT